MPVSAGVGTGDDPDAKVERPSDAGDVMLVERLGPLAHMRLRRFAVVFVDEQRRHEKDAALGHAFEMAGILVEVTAMLDRIDPGIDRDVETAPAQSMTHDSAVERMRLFDQRLHLVEVERAVAWPMPRPGAGAAGR